MASERTRSRVIGLSLLAVDRHVDTSLRRQLYDRLRDAIRSGELRPGFRLPSTRAVAEALAISRTTVADVFAQLLAENYLATRRGSGTYVASVASHEGVTAASRAQGTSWERASLRGRLLENVDIANRSETKLPIAFQPGIPALDRFPFETWSRLAARVMRRPSLEIVSYGDPAGYRPLRQAIAAQLRASKGIACSEDQIVVVGGSAQALDLICRLALDPDDEVWVENPAAGGVRGAFAVAGARVVPVPVDAEGIDVDAGRALAPRARLAHVTSAHQWPSGVTMSPARRRALLQWADEADAWIVEDEYDGVFRYDGTEPTPIASLATSGRVVWVGSFSATMFPALRIGYLVAPARLIDAFVAAKSTADRQGSTLDQAVLAEFMYEGHYGRHVKQMREVYAERRKRLLSAIETSLGVALLPPDAGMHAIFPLPDTANDVAVSQAARAAGVAAPALSMSYRGTPKNGLVLGFAVADAAATAAGVRALAKTLRETMKATFKPATRAATDVPG
jgi:GntR family transcriptional regulator/MocR family aminotransferase